MSRKARERRDPTGSVLTGFWALGHIITLLLLGATALHQHGSLDLGSPRTDLPQGSAPDLGSLG
ncbi:hypothetical protein [Streptomyces katsurahamanus]|uniref:Uncharacterized protein n=1 Tax=Streptomyces katsurahamanus TaxID=2577098 RepID=A0ABW9NWX3_9ACTN|nr:hypothetical protein [Streptomyces katsurahamanus]MQS37817.1 hypothetical protein [Streptomyces katsurahamanus]